MSVPVGSSGGAATTAGPTMAEQLAALRLPTLPPAAPGTRGEALAGTPGEARGALGAVRADYGACVDALAEVAALESRVAACKAALIDRLAAAGTTEAAALGFDTRQQGIGDASTTAELATVLCIPERSAANLRAQCVALVREHPHTLHALGAGRFSWQHALAILDQALSIQNVPDMPRDVVDAFERDLVEAACGVTVTRFTAAANRRRERLHPESIQTRAAAAREGRCLDLQPGRDGMSYLGLYLPAETAQAVWNHATAAARALQGPAEPRTLAQLRLDVAAALLLGLETADAKAGHPAPRAQILLTVPILSLLGVSDGPAELEGCGPVPASIARRLAAQAPSFQRLLTDPHSGEPVALSPGTYRVSEAMRAWLRARDRTCTFPGCTTVTADTQLDHLLAWEHGGKTREDNLASECPKHHLVKHHKDGKTRTGPTKTNPQKTKQGGSGPAGPGIRGWTPQMTETGRPGWTSPAGRYYPPEPLDTTPPEYPHWLQDSITRSTGATDYSILEHALTVRLTG
ncbi:HNH endonuclease signature motif containing protein [Arthrobacter sp. 35W]|uniref:HNH endonuclease signature motif containing protein n=1 Tax=Arthrobacter sp. 35W TaxID=1132441 RepID=UPI0003F72286|nr:HNH endonuclease signature motif containing protein [Arthrobacter sp. 35W]